MQPRLSASRHCGRTTRHPAGRPAANFQGAIWRGFPERLLTLGRADW